MPKKAKYKPQPFESRVGREVSAVMFASMLNDPGYISLTKNQRLLYVYCKLQQYGEKQKPIPDDVLTFTMNLSKVEMYGLYKRDNRAAFYRDMKALIDAGFIDCVSSGKITREKSIYRYSSRWLRNKEEK